MLLNFKEEMPRNAKEIQRWILGYHSHGIFALKQCHYLPEYTRMKKSTSGWTTFPTVIGTCGLSWNEQGITSFSFPESSEARLNTVLKKASGLAKPTATPPAWIRQLVARIKLHLKGNAQDFADVPVDFGKRPPLALAVYEKIRTLPAGTVITYGELAKRLGKPKASRAVGTALGKNPVPLIVPCHRIVASSGRLGGFSAPGGVATKIDLLDREGVCLTPPRTLATPAEWRKAVNALKKQDAGFRHLLKQVGDLDFEPDLHSEPLNSLLSAIVSQHLSTKVASTILKRVHALVSKNDIPDPHKILKTPDSELRAAGLSFMKISFLKDLAQHSVDGQLSPLDKLQQMSNEHIIKEFTRIKGVGRWTVEMYLIFNLGRADVFPVLDFGVRKGIAQLHGLEKIPDAHEMEKYGEVWKPYRTVASLYLWRSLDS
jgi:methylated-DNA-[protein]-cysteine S-methyltransferase